MHWNQLITIKPTLKQRFLLLSLAQQSAGFQSLLLECCRRFPAFWFNWFAWTYDPRKADSRLPFVLYEFQQNSLTQILTCLETGQDLLIEKSRDMGVSWLLVLTFLHQWLFKENAQFLIASRKLELADKPGDLSSLLEKARFCLKLLPCWMLPEGFSERKHVLSKLIKNPKTGAVLRAEAATTDFARGGRYKAILMDEFAFWPQDEAAFSAAGQSSPCRLVVSTPYGKNNYYAQLRFSKQIRVETLHWRLHPERDETWYLTQKKRMSVDELARELDINYNLSVRDRVYEQFTPAHKQPLNYLPKRRLVRVWDFGYLCPACVFFQIDEQDRLLVLREVLGSRQTLASFAKMVLKITQENYDQANQYQLIEDYCDPAGQQHNEHTAQTSVDILNSLGIYPQFQRSGVLEGIERVRYLLEDKRGETPAVLIDPQNCPITIEALEGGYRYQPSNPEIPLEEHPYEDVMDCLRYAVVAKMPLPSYMPTVLKHRRMARNRYNKMPAVVGYPVFYEG